jgi:hypothetical protein
MPFLVTLAGFGPKDITYSSSTRIDGIVYTSCTLSQPHPLTTNTKTNCFALKRGSNFNPIMHKPGELLPGVERIRDTPHMSSGTLSPFRDPWYARGRGLTLAVSSGHSHSPCCHHSGTTCVEATTWWLKSCHQSGLNRVRKETSKTCVASPGFSAAPLLHKFNTSHFPGSTYT